MVEPVIWLDNKIKILDQTLLPQRMEFIETVDYRDVVEAIKELRVRGAPAIGVAAAYGIALGILNIPDEDVSVFRAKAGETLQEFALARPTAVNLFYAIDRMKSVLTQPGNIAEIKRAVVNEAVVIHNKEKQATEKISRNGSALIKDNFTVLTHCNTGPLATTGYGTALGVIMAAYDRAHKIKVIATETRPLLQGARLTTWELMQAAIPVSLIVDSAAGHFMKSGKIDCVIVGADRIAANGDTANKIGTYSLAVLAHENGVPFYVAAPVSTIDFSLKDGSHIIIEERRQEEVTQVAGKAIAPEGVAALNPAFDVTLSRYITAIITENGVVSGPYRNNLKKLIKEK